MMISRTLAENLDALYAGRDSDSGIRDPELLASCVKELKTRADRLAEAHPHSLVHLDIAWDLAVELYGNERGYDAEQRLNFIDWILEEADWDR
jgi:hypothetical protein